MEQAPSVHVQEQLDQSTAMVVMFEVTPPSVSVTGTAKPGCMPAGTSALTW